MIIGKIILLQLFWFAVVLFSKSIPLTVFILIALVLFASDYILFRPKVSAGRFAFLLVLFVISGLINDLLLLFFDILVSGSYHYESLPLWIIFPLYYEVIFKKFQSLPTLLVSVVGGIGGAMSYWSAAKLGAILIAPEKENTYLLFQFLFWAVFFPLSIKMYFKEDYWNSFLDKTIFFSFDKTGFQRHQKKFNESFFPVKNPKKILVTGGTGGIGEQTGMTLAELGHHVFVTGRNQQKGAELERKNNNLNFVSLDMSDWQEVYEFARKSEILEGLVFNAGGMPEKMTTNELGIELQCASQLLGHYYLLYWLKKFHKLKAGARVVWVSSGGMYLKELSLDSLFHNLNYNKVDTYANVKRAQVTLVEELAKNPEWSDFFIVSMHPGWVGTDGLKEALPGFYRFMKNRLRNAYEGADTIIWCLLSEKAPESGKFYFDRKEVSPYIAKKYIPTPAERKELLQRIRALMPL